MADQKLYTTKLVLTGAISPEVTSQIRGLVGHLGKVRDETGKIAKESKHDFKAMESSVEGAKKGKRFDHYKITKAA